MDHGIQKVAIKYFCLSQYSGFSKQKQVFRCHKYLQNIVNTYKTGQTNRAPRGKRNAYP